VESGETPVEAVEAEVFGEPIVKLVFSLLGG